MSSMLGSLLLCVNFNSRKSKQTNSENKQAKNNFYLKSILNQVSVIALYD